jgi:predicted amino acid-binding ACT domain protein
MKEPEHQFVIQFSGTDIPGLLHTFSQPLWDLGYNISDISLATGGTVHTTFLTCKVDPTMGRQIKRNRWDAKREIYQALKKAVDEWHKSYYDHKNLSEPEDRPDVRVAFAGPEGRIASFQIDLEIDVKHIPGVVVNLADMIKGAFTINTTFDRPSQTDPGESMGRKEQEPLRRVVHLSIEYFDPVLEKAEDLKTAKEALKSFLRSRTGNDPDPDNNQALLSKLELESFLLHDQLSKRNGEVCNNDMLRAREVFGALKETFERWLIRYPPEKSDKHKRTFQALFDPKIRLGNVVYEDHILYRHSKEGQTLVEPPSPDAEAPLSQGQSAG